MSETATAPTARKLPPGSSNSLLIASSRLHHFVMEFDRIARFVAVRAMPAVVPTRLPIEAVMFHFQRSSIPAIL